VSGVSRKGALSGAAVFFFLLLLPLCLAAQIQPGNSPGGTPDISGPESLIGATLEELLSLAGPPQSVYPVRGLELWQDDVVFVYPSLDVYLFKDRVWQVSPLAAYRVTTGDTRERVEAALGPVFTEIPVREGEYALVYAMSNRPWPLALRVHFKRGIAGPDAVSALYIYRSDF
jgi:hypothetical protein